jgi:hypothetical protein
MEGIFRTHHISARHFAKLRFWVLPRYVVGVTFPSLSKTRTDLGCPGAPVDSSAQEGVPHAASRRVRYFGVL